MLRELAGEHEADRGLDLAGRERRLLGEAAELGGLEGDALEDVVNEPAARAELGRGRSRSGRGGPNEFMIDMPFLEMPVSGCTCLSTR